MAVAAVLLASLGCAGSAWESARTTDTAAAYYQYIRENPKSDRVSQAQERIAFHKVVQRPSLRAYDEFRSDYPQSELLSQLRPLVEGLAFDAARGLGTPAAYERFQQEFAGSALQSRAAGNAAFLSAGRYRGRFGELSSFAAEHPASDFAAEALRSVAAVAARRETAIHRVGLVIEIDSKTAESDRIESAFIERAMDTYKNTGLQLELIPEIVAENEDLPEARLTIRHREALESGSVVERGSVSRSAGWVARTDVTLQLSGDETPIFDRSFSFRVPAHQTIAGASSLFASKEAALYWEDFFLPVARWRSTAAVRPVIELQRRVSAVDAADGRAVVLFEDGSFQLLDLADPAKPALLASYERKSKLERFDGVRIVGGEVMLFGQDGLEVVGFGSQGAEVRMSLSRGDIGSLLAVEPVAGGLMLATSRGLVLTDENGANPERVMRRVILGIASQGETLVFTDGETVFISTLALLRQKRVMARLRVGREFAPSRVRVVGGTAIVMGKGGTIALDMANPSKPRMIAKLRRSAVGVVRDAASVGGQLFLLGTRGIALLDPQDGHIEEFVDVAARNRIARMGRHLVLVGGTRLQTLDALPFAAAPPPMPARPSQQRSR